MGEYASLENSLNKIKSNIRVLLKSNEDLMKYLIYDHDSPLSEPITEEQIEEAFTEDWTSNAQKVFRTFLIHRTDDRVCSELRIYTARLRSKNPYQIPVLIGIDVVTHLDIEVIKNQNRSDILVGLVIDTLNGKDVDAAAPLELDDEFNFDFIQYNKKFIGCRLLFKTVVAVK